MHSPCCLCQTGPSNPFKTENQRAQKNMLTGFVEPAHVSAFHFEREIRTFDTHGYAHDPSAENSDKFVGDAEKGKLSLCAGAFDSTKTGGEKRKRAINLDATDIEVRLPHNPLFLVCCLTLFLRASRVHGPITKTKRPCLVPIRNCKRRWMRWRANERR